MSNYIYDKSQKVLGIIVEYNPFHNGHYYHLQRAIENVNPEGVIAVMSPNIVQRGEFPVLNKFLRAQVALEAGVNLVLELPSIFAFQDAGGFAIGSVGVLQATNLVTHLVFGSESDDLNKLQQIAQILFLEDESYKNINKKYLKKGLSHPNARKYALKEYLLLNDSSNNGINILEKSNDILGLEYLIALKKYNSKISPITIRRLGSDYNTENFEGKFSSATAIRKLLLRDSWEEIQKALPDFSYNILRDNFSSIEYKKAISRLNSYFTLFLKSKDRDSLKRYHNIKEGIEHRLVEATKEHKDIQKILETVKSKRFTFARLRRILMYILFDVDTDSIKQANKYGPQYIRVLAFDEKGQKMLSVMRNKSSMPVITTSSKYIKYYTDFRNKSDYYSENLFFNFYKKQIELEFKISDFYNYLFSKSCRDLDILKKPIM